MSCVVPFLGNAHSRYVDTSQQEEPIHIHRVNVSYYTTALYIRLITVYILGLVLHKNIKVIVYTT